uniref:NADH-ubiquinone oxidoreductase chain 3 n=1 Tax=Haedus sp. TaxID=2931292 RepID=A0A8T9ZXQ1_9HEMI|nr:NADH dehydrogenase subunit 3 [Haedus sp.]
MLVLIITMMMPLLITMLLMILYSITSKKVNKTNQREKMTPFECGFDPMSKTRSPFSTQFFLNGILFLVFDVELSLVLPMMITLDKSNLTMWFFTTTIIMFILLVGLFYEWKNGAIQWMT